jgi:hypothetical protein
LASNDRVTLMFGVISTEMITIVSFIGGLILLGVIWSIGGFLHYRRERMLLHAERMKALELGREPPDDPETAKLKAAYQSKAELRDEAAKKTATPGGPRSLAVQCYTTTGWVAGLGLLFAAGVVAGPTPPAVSIAVAAAAGAVGVTGMICGTILAAKASEAMEASSLPESTAPLKPRFDPEAV